MRLLLDTHAFLWFITNDPQLSATATALIADPNNEILVSPAGLSHPALSHGPRCFRREMNYPAKPS